MLVENRAIFSYSRVFGAPDGGDVIGISSVVGVRKLESIDYCLGRCLLDDKFSRFDKTPACGSRINRRGTPGHSIYKYALFVRLAVKTRRPAFADRTARRQFQANDQPVS